MHWEEPDNNFQSEPSRVGLVLGRLGRTAPRPDDTMTSYGCVAGAVEPEALDNVVLSAVLTMCTVLALMLAGCLCCRRRSGSSRRDRFRRGVGGVGPAGGGYNRHRRHHHHHQQHEPRPPSLRSLSPTPSSGQHVCDELGERFASVDSV